MEFWHASKEIINIIPSSFHNKYYIHHLSRWKEGLYHQLDRIFLGHRLIMYKMITINLL